MPGANYMGGRRNSARARTKDIAGRTQKGHFMKQKHQILVRGLRNNRLEDAERRTTPNGRIEDIAFAHARRNLQHDQNTLPTRKTTAQPKTPSRGLLSSSSPHSTRQRLLKRSKILEDLDIIEPTGLKATVQRILRQPDLAGLSRLNIKPSSPRYKREIDLSRDDPRKRPRAEEVASSSSSSSFRYGSPTRKGTSGQPQFPTKRQLHPPLLSSNDNQPYSDSHTSGRSYSVLAENSMADNQSFSFSDRVSPLQDVNSNSSYPDSGFSELQFSDMSEKELGNGQGGTDVRETEAEDCYMNTSSNSSFFSSVSLPSRAREHQMSPVHAPPRYHIAGQLRQSELPKHRELSIPCTNNADEQLLLPLTARHDSRSSPGASTSHHQATGIEGFRRFGVGYAPSGLNADYKPFVPLTTMLPSYSEEDVVLAEDGLCNTNEYTNMLMDTADADDQMDDELLSTEGISTALDAGPRITGISSPRSSLKLGDHTFLQTPARRFITFPTLRSSAEHRPRSTFPLQATVSSILARDDKNEAQNPFRSDKSAFHTRNESSLPSTFSNSPVWFIPDDDDDQGQNGVSSARRDEDHVPSAFSNSPELRTPCRFDSKTTGDEGDRKAASIVQHLPANPSVTSHDGAHSVAAPGSNVQLSPLPEAGDLPPDGAHSLWNPCLPLPSPPHHDVGIPDVFDGPDIFADIDDEDE